MTKAKFFLLSLTLILMIGCSSDDDVTNTLKEDYFKIDDSKFKDGETPKGESEGIETFRTSHNVINGGSSFVTIQTSKPLSEIYVGVDNKEGYYVLKAAKYLEESSITTRGSDERIYTYRFTYQTPQGTVLEKYTLLVSGKFEDGTLSIQQVVDIEVVEVGTGKLQVALAWDLLDDVDLHFFTPRGEHIYYHNRQEYIDGELYVHLDRDSNPNCNIDGINKENIYLDALPVGVYSIALDLYKKCDYTTENTYYDINVTYGGATINLGSKLQGIINRDSPRTMHIASFEVDELGNIRVVNDEEASTRSTEYQNLVLPEKE